MSQDRREGAGRPKWAKASRGASADTVLKQPGSWWGICAPTRCHTQAESKPSSQGRRQDRRP